jgi:hypothetical protein
MKASEAHINSFVRRQTLDSSFTHFEGTDVDLLARIERSEKIEPGYRNGVVLVVLEGEDAENFFTGLVTLKEGDKLVGEFAARREGEVPRKSIRLKNETGAQRFDNNPQPNKQPCKRVDVVCYSHDTLAEDGDAESDKPWEIIALNGYPTTESAPIAPNVLMHSHFHTDGGTATNMTPEEFEAALRESFLYWKDKALME